MRILLPGRTTEVLRHELAVAKKREIGGVLVGEHLDGETFRIADLSVQRTGGSSQHFMRELAQHQEFLRQFFERTGYDYERYNYIGEWHSHTFAPALPSSTDCATMEGIVNNPAVGVAFAVLLVARLDPWSGLQLSATAFRSGQPPDPVALVADPDGGTQRFRQVHPRVRRRLIWI
jgi:[CysO sulfur-carrier protein]-S-L-cysteine hydrolase